ncbi:MAG: glycosyltransferase family 2 protein [Pirellulales bacterium]|nr:glycosyltransferase family 2 protein [Pirellulales bacterium]
MAERVLTALPVFNEVAHVGGVLDLALRYCRDVLVVDDGSTDGTADLLARRGDVRVLAHRRNRGYGAALRTAFRHAVDAGYDVLVTIDCDGQHEPQRIPRFVEALADADVVSGSRYRKRFPGDSQPPKDRRRVNQHITRWINRRLGLGITDAFCGFKAYRTWFLDALRWTETGYAMPLEFWAQAARMGLRIVEEPVPLVYLDPRRSFGGALDDAATRQAVYEDVLRRSLVATCPVAPCGLAGCPCAEGVA